MIYTVPGTVYIYIYIYFMIPVPGTQYHVSYCKPFTRSCRPFLLASSVDSNKSDQRMILGQRSFELLRTMAGVMAVGTEHVPDLVREVPEISSVSKDDFLRFVQCRADFSEKSGAGLVRWIEEFYALGGMSE